MGWCERCDCEREGDRCPVCGSLLLQEIHPEDMPADMPVPQSGQMSGETGPAWPSDPKGEPEEPVFLTNLQDVGGYPQLLEARLSAVGIPVVIRYPREGGLGRVVLGFSGYGAEFFVPASRLKEARELLEFF